MVEEELEGAAASEDTDWALMDADEQTRNLPATYANRIYVKHEGAMLRVALGEQAGDETIYRTCFMIPNAVAIDMGELLARMGTQNLEFNMKAWRDWAATEAAKSNG